MLFNEMNSNAKKLERISRFLKEAHDYDLNLDALSVKKARAMIAHTTKKIAKLKESKGSQSEINRLVMIKESLRLWTTAEVQSELTAPSVKRQSTVSEGLGETEVEEAKVILAAQEMADRLQKMVEDIAQMQVQDLMPIVDAMKADIGTGEAEAFSSAVEGVLGELLDTAKSAKDGVTNAILSAQGQAPTDMGDDMGGPGMDDMGDDEFGDDEFGDDEFGGADAATGPDEEPLGREMKDESFKESVADVFEQMLADIQSKTVAGRVKESDVKAALNKFKSGKQPVSESAGVTFDTSKFENAHGKKPSGTGAWAFSAARNGSKSKTSKSMTYSKAKAWAKQQFPDATTIYVLS